MVLLVGIEERLRRAVGCDLIDLAVWRRGDVQPAIRRRSDGVDFQFGRVEEGRELSVLRDAEDLALVAGARPERAVCARDHRPEEGGRRVGDDRRGRAEEHPAVAVDRKVLDVSLQEIRLRRNRPERRHRGVEPRGQDSRQDAGDREDAPGEMIPADPGSTEHNNGHGLRLSRKAGARTDQRPAGARVSTSIARTREPLTAESIGTSHWPTAALRIGV